MNKLEDEFVDWQLKEWAKDDGDYPLSNEQIRTAKNLYNNLMNEESNRLKSPEVQEGLLAEIARKLSYGESSAAVFRQHGDNKHMNYFDTFMEVGTTDDIAQALSERSIPTSVLRGLSKNQSHNSKHEGVEVTQVVDRPDGTSPVITEFRIEKDGEVIYEWNRKKDYFQPEYSDYDEEENDYIKEVPQEYKITSTGNTRVHQLVKRESIQDITYDFEQPDDNGIAKVRYAAGTVIDGVKVGGRFVKWQK